MKRMFLVLAVLFSFFALHSQERKADVVVLLDISGTMLPHYSDINDRVLEQLCSDFVRIGDTFHLISFAEKPSTEISQKISQQSDIQKIVSRFSLLYPLGAFSDFLNGLLYSQQYIASLDVYSQKVLVIISDGIFNPSKNSPYFTLSSLEVENSIQNSIQTMISQGVYVYYIKAPFPELADGSETYTEYATKLQGMSSVITTDLHAASHNDGESFIGNVLQQPLISCPQDLGKKHYSFSLPLTITNTSNSQILLQLDKVLINNQNVLDSTLFINIKPDSSSLLSVPITLPQSYEPGQNLLQAQFIFADNVRTNPQQLQWSLFLLEGNAFFARFSSSTLRILIIPLAIILCLIVFFVILALSKKLSNAKIYREDEQPTAENQLHNNLGTLESAKVSSSKLTLPAMADSIVQQTSAKTSNSGTAYKKSASLSIDSSKISSMDVRLGAKQTSIPPSEIQKNSAQELTTYKQDQTLSLSQAGSYASSNKLLMPTLPKATDTLRLPSMKSFGFNTSIAPASANDKIPTAKAGTIILELYVEGQTRQIGTRNIHALSAGSRKSIGGGLSIFSIFFVKVPSSIAEIRYDGKTCTLALLKPEYFPEAESSIIENCLDVPIKVRSEHGYLTTIMFTEYQSQTEKLNNLLLSIIPEEDKKRYL